MEVLRKGADGAILAYGHMVKTALEAARLLEADGIQVEVVNARFVKPLDHAGVLQLAERHDRILTLEDHVIAGGFGSAVLESLAAQDPPRAQGPVRAQVQVLGLPDRFLEHASREELLAELGLDAKGVAAKFRTFKPVAAH